MAKAIPLAPDSITHGIQLAVAPVFLLTAVSGMIGVVAGRLASMGYTQRRRIVEDGRPVSVRIVCGDASVAGAQRRRRASLRRDVGRLHP